MEIKDEDFSRLFVPVHGLPESTAIIPAFKKFNKPEFIEYRDSQALNINKVLRYISYLYSEHSPLISFYKQDLQARKETAAELAGFQTSNKKEWSKVQKDLFELSDPLIVKMMIRFLIMQRNITWSEICVLEQEHEEYMRKRLASDVESKEKNALRAACDKIIDSLNKHYDRLFLDNDDLREKYGEDNNAEHFTSPEEVANKLNENPYK